MVGVVVTGLGDGCGVGVLFLRCFLGISLGAFDGVGPEEGDDAHRWFREQGSVHRPSQLCLKALATQIVGSRLLIQMPARRAVGGTLGGTGGVGGAQ